MQIHTDAESGNIAGVAHQLAQGVPIDSVDRWHIYPPQTPLMCAVISPSASLEMVRFLLESGADIHVTTGKENQSALSLAVENGDVDKVRLLLDAGADINYKRPKGYDVMIDAMYGCPIEGDEQLVALVKLLLDRGAPVDGLSDYGESGLNVAFKFGRSDVARLLRAAGGGWEWTDLMYAVALGSGQDVQQALATGTDLETRDFWSRTPLLLSFEIGDMEKARLLLEAGANRDARGHCGISPLMYAIEGQHLQMLAWLLAEGYEVEAKDDFNRTALMKAAEDGCVECVRLLLAAGARLDPIDHIEQRAIMRASTLEVVKLLLEAGEDLNDIDDSMRAALTGVEYDGELSSTQDDYLAGKRRRFGTANPELMNVEFWRAMVRSGVPACWARTLFEDREVFTVDKEPVWSFHRFGKSITAMPDGRFIEIGGEHEDSYDPDFCIYNDVIVHHGGGRFDIFGYPEAVFPPTDFHSATLVGDYIYIIGSLGYMGERNYGETPVYRLNYASLAIKKVETTGQKPGWIYRHKAVYQTTGEIHLSGGKICTRADEQQVSDNNTSQYVLDLTHMKWRRVEG